jgi:hypothetical protein
MIFIRARSPARHSQKGESRPVKSRFGTAVPATLFGFRGRAMIKNPVRDIGSGEGFTPGLRAAFAGAAASSAVQLPASASGTVDI